MKPDLLNRIFEIQNKINEITFSKYDGLDQGMFVPQKDPEEYWRDNTYSNENNTYSFSFSTKGNLVGDLPPDCALDILTILESYKN
jgi:hypothetical protein